MIALPVKLSHFHARLFVSLMKMKRFKKIILVPLITFLGCFPHHRLDFDIKLIDAGAEIGTSVMGSGINPIKAIKEIKQAKTFGQTVINIINFGSDLQDGYSLGKAVYSGSTSNSQQQVQDPQSQTQTLSKQEIEGIVKYIQSLQ